MSRKPHVSVTLSAAKRLYVGPGDASGATTGDFAAALEITQEFRMLWALTV